MAVWYLDNDDEITDAVARLRNADDKQVVFVVPPGSRIATGRINFRLLAREAESRAMALAIASPDEQVRALAASAGVLVAVTPDQAEAALERGDTAPEPTSVAPAATDASAGRPAGTATSAEATAGALRWRSQRLRVASVALLVLVIIGGFVAWQTLPTAEITITPHVATIGPLEIPVMATAEVDAVDSESGLVPAVLVPIPLSAEDGYDSSGTRTAGSRASGSVVFSAQDQAFDQEIAAGTRVLTPAGTAFATTETVILRRSQLGRSEVRADVEAIATGDVGNVPAGAISVVPSLEDQGIGVDNPEPTSGGRLQETPLVVAGDYDAAAVDLRNRLAGQLAAYLDDPANSPAGLTLFPETAVLGPVTLEPPAAELVGSGVASFTLAGSARAGVLAVDMGSVEALLRERLTAAVPAGMAILSDSVVVEPGEGIAEGDGIAFAGVTSGRAVTVIDRDELLDRIAGLPVSDARSILDALGSATVNVWPEFLGDLPEDRQRITLDIVAVSATE